jgi:hypothetical protein
MEFKSFGITINVKPGIVKGSKLEENLLKATKTANYYQIVSEKDGCERHFHIQLWFDDKKKKGDIKKKFERILSKEMFWDVDHKRHAIKIKICYNDWILNYCEENELKLNGDDYSDMILDNMPAITEDYYPSEEEQENIKNKANAKDQKFYSWLELWNKYEYKCDNPRDIDIAEFLGDMMFKSKTIPVIVDDKARRQNCKCLLAYIQGCKSAHLFMSNFEYESYLVSLNM